MLKSAGMSTSLSLYAALASAALGVYGSYADGTLRAGAVGIAFACLFFFTQRRASHATSMPLLQIVLVLGLVGLSFILHLAYLPAGICCFFALMLCKNELLMPPAPPSTKKRQ